MPPHAACVVCCLGSVLVWPPVCPLSLLPPSLAVCGVPSLYWIVSTWLQGAERQVRVPGELERFGELPMRVEYAEGRQEEQVGPDPRADNRDREGCETCCV
jgi:hypothetical protein